MKRNGFTLVELMVTLVIAGVLLRIGIVSLNDMLAASKSKAISESIMSGLRLARAEAIKRNVPMRFQMVSSLGNESAAGAADGCNYSATSSLWVVSQGDTATTATIAGKNHGLVKDHCGAAAYIPPDQPDICAPTPVTQCPAAPNTLCRGQSTGTNTNPANCEDDPLIAFKSDAIVYPNIGITGTNTAGCDPFGGVCTPASVVTFGPLGRVSINTVGGASIVQIDVAAINPDATRNGSVNRWRIQIAAGTGTLRLCNPDATAGAAQACR